MIWRQFIFSATGESVNTLINLRVEAGLPAPQSIVVGRPSPHVSVSLIPEIEKGREVLSGFGWKEGDRKGERGRDVRAGTQNEDFQVYCHMPYNIIHPRVPGTEKKLKTICSMWFDFFLKKLIFSLAEYQDSIYLYEKKRDSQGPGDPFNGLCWIPTQHLLPSFCFPDRTLFASCNQATGSIRS